MANRDPFAREALALVPKMLTLQDRNPHSPTYGCFDRNFWHYRIIDFPSGMAQELVWPLALAYDTDLPGNRFRGQAAIRDWVEAGVLYAARSAHADGSCDDYFPYERAAGAAAFSLLACIESCHLLGIARGEALRLFERRADWLARHHESGRLANHEALIALCLERASEVVGTSRWDGAKAERLERVLSWQSREGWFQEYDGCDPGYHTLSVSLLARLYEIRRPPGLREALERAVAFAAEFVHPDGSYGGEYGSRNTYNFFPHGFELVGRWMPEALALNDGVLAALDAGLAPCYADDHILGHHAWNYLLAWRDFVPERPGRAPRGPGRTWFVEAGLVVDRRDGNELYLALNKGGAFKLFREGRLVASDTQVSLRLAPKGRNAVGHMVGDYACRLESDEIAVRGRLSWAKQTRMTPLRMIALRLLMLGPGRLFPDLVRRILQRLLITGRREAPFEFFRVLRWSNGGWRVRDEIRSGSWSDLADVGVGPAQTSVYNVMSRVFQPGQMQPWLDLRESLEPLAPGQPLLLERDL